MGRLIEVQEIGELPPGLTLRVGDVLWFAASGGRVRSGDTNESAAADAIQVLGPFLQGVLGPGGRILTPAGPPSAVLFLALRPGSARIEVVAGDPWHGPRTTSLSVTVEP